MINKSKFLFIILCFTIIPKILFASSSVESTITNNSLIQIDSLIEKKNIDYNILKLDLLILNENLLKSKSPDSIEIFKKLALLNAEFEQEKDACKFTDKYIINSFDFTILNDRSYEGIKDSNEFKLLKKKYQFKFDIFSAIYIYISLIGIFIIFILNVKNDVDRIVGILVSGFVLSQILFVLEYLLYQTNLQLRYPHSYLVSSSFALLIGPFLFFYIKRITKRHVFKFQDLFHLLPTSLLIIFVLYPVYDLDGEEKVKAILGLTADYSKYGLYVFLSKLISLSIYGIFIFKLNFNKVKKPNNFITAIIRKNIISYCYLFYVFTYMLYGLALNGMFTDKFHFLSVVYNFHLLSIAFTVGYISYVSFLYPKLFSFKIDDNKKYEVPKYLNSGLSATLSKDLTNKMIKLFTEEKVYKNSSITLDYLADLLGTSRNNTSQILNEHFGVNFFEIINKFRIEEAINIFESDRFRNLKIKEVAFEVGYNNKVTFTKAFKKYTNKTPSKFLLDSNEVKRE